MVVRIHIFPRREILDPQGKAIASALKRLGFGGIEDVRAGKSFELALDDCATRESVVQMCEKLLANLVVEDYEIEWPAEAGA